MTEKKLIKVDSQTFKCVQKHDKLLARNEIQKLVVRLQMRSNCHKDHKENRHEKFKTEASIIDSRATLETADQ